MTDLDRVPDTSQAPALPARRLGAARWRNPQLIVGVLLVLACVAVTTRIVSSADDTVPVLVAVRDIKPGQELTADMLETRDVQLGDTGGSYLAADIGSGYVVTRAVSAGELMPQSALTPADELGDRQAIRYVSIAMPSAELPAGLTSGASVDVWITPANGGAEASRLASAIRVSSAEGGSGGALGVAGSSSTITLAMRAAGKEDAPSLAQLVSKLVAAGRDGRVYLSRLPSDVGE